MIEPTCTGPNQTQPEPNVSSEAGLKDQSSLPVTLVSEGVGEREQHMKPTFHCLHSVLPLTLVVE